MKSRKEKLPEGVALTNICSSTGSGVVLVIMRNAGPMMDVMPTLNSAVLTPDAMPRLMAGTEFMMDDLFGDANMPVPLPTSSSAGEMAGNVMVLPRVSVRSRKPADETTGQTVEIHLAPKRSDSMPLTGPKATSDAEMGIRNMPACKGPSLMLGPCS